MGGQVHMLVRGKAMRASNTLQDRVAAHKKVNVMYGITVEDAYGDGRGLSGVRLLHTPSGALTCLISTCTCTSARLENISTPHR